MTTAEKERTSSSRIPWNDAENKVLIECWSEYEMTGEIFWDDVLVKLREARPGCIRSKKACERRISRLQEYGLAPRHSVDNTLSATVDTGHAPESFKKYDVLPKGDDNIVAFLCENSDMPREEIAANTGLTIDDVNRYFSKYGIKSTIMKATHRQISMIQRWGPYRDSEWLQQKTGLPSKTVDKIIEEQGIKKYELAVSEEQHNMLKKLVPTFQSWDEITEKVFGKKVKPDAVISYAHQHGMIGPYDMKPIELEDIIAMIVGGSNRRDILDKFPYKNEYDIETAVKRANFPQEWIDCVQRDYNDRMIFDGEEVGHIQDDYIFADDGTAKKKPKWIHTPKDLIVKELSKKDNWCSIPYLVDMVKKRLKVNIEPHEVHAIIRTIDKIEARNVASMIQGRQKRYNIRPRSGVAYTPGVRMGRPSFSGRVRTPVVLGSDLHVGYGDTLPGAWSMFVKFVKDLKNKFGHVDIILSGDIIEGTLVYTGQDLNKSADVDIEAQVETVINMFRDLDDDDISIHMTDGNHEFVYMKKNINGGQNPLKQIAMALDNVIYHGEVAWLQLNENKVIAAIHGERMIKSGSMQTKAEKFLSGVDMGFRPDFIQMGHVHRRMEIMVGDTQCFVVPSLIQPPTELVTSQMIHTFNCGFTVIYSIDADGVPLSKFYKLTDGGANEYEPVPEEEELASIYER